MASSRDHIIWTFIRRIRPAFMLAVPRPSCQAVVRGARGFALAAALAAGLFAIAASALAQEASYKYGSASATCSSGIAGAMWYDTANNVIKWCNGSTSTWSALGSSAAAGSTGQIQYNSGNAFTASASLTWTNSTTTLAAPTVSATSDVLVGSTSGAAAPTGPALSNLSDVSIASPSSGQVLSYNGTNWVNGTGSGGGGPFGSTTQVAFNNAGTESGSSDFTWNDSTKTLTVDAANTNGATLNVGVSGSNSNIIALGPVTGAAAPSGYIGTCNISAFVLSTTETTETCSGVPASTAVAVICSPSGAYSTASRVVGARANGTANQIAMVLSGTNTNSLSYHCMWVQ